MMDLELQELSTNSSSDGERSEYDIRDHEIVEALRAGEEIMAPAPQRPSRVWTVARGFGMLMLVVGVVAALGFIFYDGQQTQKEQQHLIEEMKQIEAFVQFEPEEVVFVEEEFSGDTLKITDPPPM